MAALLTDGHKTVTTTLRASGTTVFMRTFPQARGQLGGMFRFAAAVEAQGGGRRRTGLPAPPEVREQARFWTDLAQNAPAASATSAFEPQLLDARANVIGHVDLGGSTTRRLPAVQRWGAYLASHNLYAHTTVPEIFQQRCTEPQGRPSSPALEAWGAAFFPKTFAKQCTRLIVLLFTDNGDPGRVDAGCLPHWMGGLHGVLRGLRLRRADRAHLPAHGRHAGGIHRRPAGVPRHHVRDVAAPVRHPRTFHMPTRRRRHRGVRHPAGGARAARHAQTVPQNQARAPYAHHRVADARHARPPAQVGRDAGAARAGCGGSRGGARDLPQRTLTTTSAAPTR